MTVETKALLKYTLIVSVYFLFVFAMIGCTEQLTIQPELHPTAGTSVMLIPEGCKIGDITTSEKGIYISESELIEAMRQQRKEEEQEYRGKHIQR